jgi:SAM-dependent MidA family methyltransferase
MEAALYHPTLGYYCRPGMTTGPDGDFYTSADLHPVFGRLLARQVAEMAQRTARDDRAPFHLVECGPGTGRLARDLIAGLVDEHPDLARRTVVTLVEISPTLRAVQRRTIEEEGLAGSLAGVGWASWSELIERSHPGGFSGCVVANEFLDALPVHAVEIRDGELKEVHVGYEEDEFRELLLEPSTGRLAAQRAELAGLGVTLEEGQRAEFGLAALGWVASLGRVFGEDGTGGAILVDYGHPASELYDPARHRGTLLCYHRHQTSDDPYTRVGEQDMTAHVDFTTIERRARGAGFDVAPLTSQLRFLVAMGLAQRIADLAAQPDTGVRGVQERLALHGLMAPGGMGEVFKVMLLARGAEASSFTGAKDPFR